VFADELRRATLRLPSGVAGWVAKALRSGWFRIEPGAYEDGDPEGPVCPIVAAATMAGAWLNGRLLPGNSEWGDSNGPTPAVEDFAAYFDLCAGELGTANALEIASQTLGRMPDHEQRWTAGGA
jgi:hypothetical protein